MKRILVLGSTVGLMASLAIAGNADLKLLNELEGTYYLIENPAAGFNCPGPLTFEYVTEPSSDEPYAVPFAVLRDPDTRKGFHFPYLNRGWINGGSTLSGGDGEPVAIKYGLKKIGRKNVELVEKQKACTFAHIGPLRWLCSASTTNRLMWSGDGNQELLLTAHGQSCVYRKSTAGDAKEVVLNGSGVTDRPTSRYPESIDFNVRYTVFESAGKRYPQPHVKMSIGTGPEARAVAVTRGNNQVLAVDHPYRGFLSIDPFLTSLSTETALPLGNVTLGNSMVVSRLHLPDEVLAGESCRDYSLRIWGETYGPDHPSIVDFMLKCDRLNRARLGSVRGGELFLAIIDFAAAQYSPQPWDASWSIFNGIFALSGGEANGLVYRLNLRE